MVRTIHRDGKSDSRYAKAVQLLQNSVPKNVDIPILQLAFENFHFLYTCVSYLQIFVFFQFIQTNSYFQKICDQQ